MKFRAGLSALAILAGLVAAMTTVPAGNRAEAAAACPFVLVLSCVVEKNGFRHDAWTNACLAKAAGLRYLHAGACQGLFCTNIYSPVCSINPATGRAKTYSNRCWSDAANAILIHNGKCRLRK